MKTNIQETIDRLHELDQTASPVPWSYNPWSANSNGEVTQNITYGWGEEEEILIGEVSYLLTEHDAEMIAESRNAIPVLLAEIDRLTTRLSISEWRLVHVATNHPGAYLAALCGDEE